MAATTLPSRLSIMLPAVLAFLVLPVATAAPANRLEAAIMTLVLLVPVVVFVAISSRIEHVIGAPMVRRFPAKGLFTTPAQRRTERSAGVKLACLIAFLCVSPMVIASTEETFEITATSLVPMLVWSYIIWLFGWAKLSFAMINMLPPSGPDRKEAEKILNGFAKGFLLHHGVKASWSPTASFQALKAGPWVHMSAFYNVSGSEPMTEISLSAEECTGLLAALTKDADPYRLLPLLPLTISVSTEGLTAHQTIEALTVHKQITDQGAELLRKTQSVHT